MYSEIISLIHPACLATSPLSLGTGSTCDAVIPAWRLACPCQSACQPRWLWILSTQLRLLMFHFQSRVYVWPSAKHSKWHGQATTPMTRPDACMANQAESIKLARDCTTDCDEDIVHPGSADVAGTLDQQTAAVPLRAIQCSDRLDWTEGRHRMKQHMWTLLTSSSIVYEHDNPY